MIYEDDYNKDNLQLDFYNWKKRKENESTKILKCSLGFERNLVKQINVNRRLQDYEIRLSKIERYLEDKELQISRKTSKETRETKAAAFATKKKEDYCKKEKLSNKSSKVKDKFKRKEDIKIVRGGSSIIKTLACLVLIVSLIAVSAISFGSLSKKVNQIEQTENSILMKDSLRDQQLSDLKDRINDVLDKIKIWRNDLILDIIQIKNHVKYYDFTEEDEYVSNEKHDF